MTKRGAVGDPDGHEPTQRPRLESEYDGSYSGENESSPSEEQEDDDVSSWPCHDEGFQALKMGKQEWIAQNAREYLLKRRCPLRDYAGERARAASRVALCVIPCA